jgi:hypothetical protein
MKSNLIPEIIFLQENIIQKRKNKQSIDLCSVEPDNSLIRSETIIVKD